MGKKIWSRREVLKQSGMMSAAAAAGAIAPGSANALAKAAKAAPAKAGAAKAGQVLTGHDVPFTDGDFHDNLFTRIGIRPLINCRGTITAISGSTSLPEVKQAMYNASLYHVRMDEMMAAVGAELGRLCGAEYAMATTGAAAATCLATIACVAGTNIEQCQALPYIKKKDQVVIPKTSRNPYDIGARMCGMEMVEFTTPEELRDKISERTAMMYFLANPRWDNTPMSLKNLAAICKEKGVPVYVDAAAMEPNVPNVHLEAGADLVAYSGGKCMRGPQSAGMLIGNKSLCQAAYYQDSPHHCYARAMKCSKEETMGLLAAVRAWHKRDHEAEQKMWLGWMQSRADRMKGLPSVTATVLPPPPPNHIDRSPGVRISWDANVLKITGSEMVQLLDEAPTRIVLNGTGSRPDHMMSSVTVYCYIMTPEEVKIVGDAIHNALTNPPHFENPVVPTGAPASVAGTWDVTIHYIRGTGEQHFVLKQDGNNVTGDHKGEIYNAEFKGTVHADEIDMVSVLPVTGYPVTCHFKGKVQGNRMSGTLNMREYGEVPWEAVRA
ncbi:MAG TPA: aminotransferase class V-fold PLP-dependent enzyme [Edaphobacter sp.]|nr:aminotransferase class V-fold PLP-dependent enzyme [Edaphobacter sp.]